MEKTILREILERKHKGLFSPADLFNGIGKGVKEKEIHELISEGYIEEVPIDRPFSEIGSHRMVKSIIFYRLSSRGKKFIAPAYKRVFYFMQNKTKFLIAIIATAAITATITWLVTNYLNKII